MGLAVLLVKDMLVDDLRFVLSVKNLIGLALGKGGVYILDGLEAYFAGMFNEVEIEFLRLHVGLLDRMQDTNVRLRWWRSLS